jgi:hypothetical protein
MEGSRPSGALNFPRDKGMHWRNISRPELSGVQRVRLAAHAITSEDIQLGKF